MILKYISSNGQEFDLKAADIRARSANFHDYQWTPQIKQLQFGDRVYRFDKEALYYTVLLDIRGGIEHRKETLNALHAAFDADVYALEPGRIVHGDYYIHCFINFSSTYANNPFTNNEITIYCPYPFWIREHTYEFLPKEELPDANAFLDYDYDFSYDYESDLTGQAYVINPGAGAANYKTYFFGPAVNPYMVIDGNTIGLNTTIETGEYVVIDSRNHTVIRVANNGRQTNLYNQRVKTNKSIFDKIAPGEHSIVYPGTFGFNFVIYEERSEPKWS